MTPIYSISAEGLLLYNWDVDLNAGEYGHSVFPSDMKKLFVTPAARVNLFPTTAVSPWISFAAGFGHISQNNQLIYGGTNPGKSTTSAVIEAGFGLDVKFGESSAYAWTCVTSGQVKRIFRWLRPARPASITTSSVAERSGGSSNLPLFPRQ